MAFKLFQKDPEAAFIVAPSDHIVTDIETFKQLSLEGLTFAHKKTMRLLRLALNQLIQIPVMVIFSMIQHRCKNENVLK